jgi:hypothetical protein
MTRNSVRLLFAVLLVSSTAYPQSHPPARSHSRYRPWPVWPIVESISYGLVRDFSLRRRKLWSARAANPQSRLLFLLRFFFQRIEFSRQLFSLIPQTAQPLRE